jgi:FADH2 O2-dependent halogenase
LWVRYDYDIAVIGSGFAGSLMAMIARRLGLSVVLLERGKHPRVVIGESSTPLANLLLEQLAERYDLPWLKPLTKWGSWQKTYPQIACGLKRGFSFFQHEIDGGPGLAEDDRHLLVAASPNDAIGDTHWWRAGFDAFLVEQARAMGVAYCDEVQVGAVREGGGWRLALSGGSERQVCVKFVVDASGPRGVMHWALGLEELPLPGYPATSALYSHFSGVTEFEGYRPAGAPYPVDDAAVHHVFEGGWIWMLRFNNGLTSAGVAATRETAERFGLADGERGWERLLETLPLVKAQFAGAKAELPFTYAKRMTFRSAEVAGEGWAMLPSAAGFVDPLLSTGFPLTLLGVLRLGEIVARDWGTLRFSDGLAAYAARTDEELVATAGLIGALYRTMGDFATFRCLSLLYFAAASYAETARRLGKAELADSFLLCRHPVFGAEMREIVGAAGMISGEELRERVYRLIEGFDVAGLRKRPGDHCYPVLAEDLFAGAGKLGATAGEIKGLLEQTGFYAVR